MSNTGPLQPQELSALRQIVHGRVVAPGDEDWDAERQPWHLLSDQHPAAVVHVADPGDVVAVVRFALRHRRVVAAQPVGHGAQPGGGLDGTLLVRLGALQELAVDREARTARVGAGVRARDLAAALTGTGLTGLPGSSGDPTVVGYTLGGGLGWFARAYGLAANHVCAVELVTPQGELLRADATSASDLYWAVRGGGGDFGVVTAIEIDLHPAEHVYGGRLVWPAEHAREILTTFAKLTTTAPEELTLWAWVLNLPDLPMVPEPLRGRGTVAVDSTYLGPAAEAEEYLAPLRAIAPPVLDTVDTLPLSAVGTIAMEPEDPTPALMQVWALDRCDDEVLDALLDVLRPGEPSPLLASGIRHLGGALTRPDDTQGAAGHLDAPYLIVTGGMVPVPEAGGALVAELDRLQAAVGSHVGTRMPLSLATGEPVEALFPAATLARLREVKRRWDPREVIRGSKPVHGTGVAAGEATGEQPG